MLNYESQLYLMSFLGVPYRWGGSNPISGLDCSGLCQEILMAAGIDLPGDQSAQAFFDHFSKPENSTQQKAAGALCFYGKGPKNVSHMTMMINSWQCIGANGGGSSTTSLDAAIKQDAFIKMRPHDYRRDLIGVYMPRYRE